MFRILSIHNYVSFKHAVICRLLKDSPSLIYLSWDDLAERKAWLPDGYSQILRLFLFGPSGLKDYGSATLRCKI